MPRVSVIIPTYNRSKLLANAIDSVLDQTFDDLEIIVVDDGSTDETSEVVKGYGDKVNYKYLENKGMGGSYARNRGIEAASGEYIAFLDSDDFWLPEKLEKQMALLIERPDLSWAYCDSEAIDGSSGQLIYRHGAVHNTPSGDVLEQLFIKNFLHTSTLIVKRNVFEQVGNFWATPKATDRDMWLRIAAEYPIGQVPEVLVRYRIHLDRVTDNLSGEDSFNAGLALIKRAMDRNPERLTRHKNLAQANMNNYTGMLLVKHTRLREARTYFLHAIRLQPTMIISYLYFISTFLSPGWLYKINVVRRRMR